MAQPLLDAGMVSVPFESLKRVTRERKYVIEEVEGVVRGVAAAVAGGPGAPATAADAAAHLGQYVEQLQGLKRKVGGQRGPAHRVSPRCGSGGRLEPAKCRCPTRLPTDTRRSLAHCLQLEATSLVERDDLARCRARLQHLQDLGVPDHDAQIEWSRRRIDCLLVDHMLRSGYNGAAAALAAQAGIQVGGSAARLRVRDCRARACCAMRMAGCSGSQGPHVPARPPPTVPPPPRCSPPCAQPLVELHIFAGAQHVVEALRRHDCGPALAWCEEHRPRLRKAKSRLEFKLRVQVGLAARVQARARRAWPCSTVPSLPGAAPAPPSPAGPPQVSPRAPTAGVC